MDAIEDAVRAILMRSVGEALDVEVEYGIRQVERAVDTNKEENERLREMAITQCRRREIELVYSGERDDMISAEVRQILVDEFGEETVAALARE